MKSAVAVSSSLLNLKNLLIPNTRRRRLTSLTSVLLPKLSLKSITNHTAVKLLPSSATSGLRFISSSSMASSFKPEQARVPSALPLPAPPLTKFNMGLCQLSVTTDKKRNISHAKDAIEEAASKGAKLVLLSEMWNTPYTKGSFRVFAEDVDAGGDASPSTAMLSEVSKRLKITIIGGSIPEKSGGRLYNTCCVFGSDGELKAKHRKIHLFDIDIPGKITYMESRTFSAGETPTVVDTDVGRIGIGICYDIRFQELAMMYAARGAHLLCYPGAFNMTTGPLHWELLQRARATDNQLYVATCSSARDYGYCYVAWGHSSLVGPFGEIIATTEHEEAIIIAEIDYSFLEQRRSNLPLNKQRRGDLYQLVDIQRLNKQMNAAEVVHVEM
ncbi:omega-amidase, chloroplastic isoform X1 [Brassica napus]|uniref:omega-amidase, chloroplastic isoform X1 n=1 Tax=Brassica napus TaxID=3708 RepID=UPI00207922FE|nr:omega-amidase, chloroplastic isoform X1 [Brassica napus]XP_048625214.1 omega-amidase, chloroplastic isoform X1 [Brassica napus]